jgi:hypothetical protein
MENCKYCIKPILYLSDTLNKKYYLTKNYDMICHRHFNKLKPPIVAMGNYKEITDILNKIKTHDQKRNI